MKVILWFLVGIAALVVPNLLCARLALGLEHQWDALTVKRDFFLASWGGPSGSEALTLSL